MEVLEAGRLHGRSWFLLVRNPLRLCIRSLVTVATFVFILSWNEFLLALFLTTLSARTFPIVVSFFISTGRVYGILMPSGSRWPFGKRERGPPIVRRNGVDEPASTPTCLMAAASMIVIIPAIIVVTLFMQRHIPGLTIGP